MNALMVEPLNQIVVEIAAAAAAAVLVAAIAIAIAAYEC